MDCETVRLVLVNARYGELPEEERCRLQDHLRSCPPCREEASALDELIATLDRVRVPAPAAGLMRELIVRVSGIPSPAGKPEARPFAGLHRLGGPFALGSLVAALSMFVVMGAVPPDPLPPLALAVLGAAWAGLFGGTFAIALQGRSQASSAAQVALVAAGLTVIAVPVLSIPTVVEACRGLFAWAAGSVPLNLIVFFMGSAYTAAPVVLATGALRRRIGSSDLRRQTEVGAFYALLIAPAVYLECAPLAISIIATWVAGAALGISVGTPAGFWLARRLAPTRA